jgi:uncharacterized membrane protein YkvA (DUF1232 family)
MWWHSIVWTIVALVAAWIGLIAVLVVKRPDGATLPDLMQLLPDTIRCVRRLAADHTLPRSTRFSVWFLLAYLASPIDLVPDFVPLIGYADDVIVTALVLRRLARRAGPDKLREHWPGTPDGLARLQRLLRLPTSI